MEDTKKEKIDIIDLINKDRAIVNLSYNKAHYIKVNESLIKEISIDASIIIGVMIDLENLSLSRYRKMLRKTKGYFPMKTSYLEKRLGMSYHRQSQAINKLLEKKLIFSKKWEGNIYVYMLNHKELSKFLIDGAIEKMNNLEEEGLIFNDFDKKVEDINSLKRLIDESFS